jgi:hypothetical protein
MITNTTKEMIGMATERVMMAANGKTACDSGVDDAEGVGMMDAVEDAVAAMVEEGVEDLGFEVEESLLAKSPSQTRSGNTVDVTAMAI